MTAEEWYNKGVTLVRAGKLQEALEAHDKATKLNPQYAGAWCGKGATLVSLGRYQEGREAQAKAAELGAGLL